MNVYEYVVYFVQDAERLHEMSLKNYKVQRCGGLQLTRGPTLEAHLAPEGRFRLSGSGVV